MGFNIFEDDHERQSSKTYHDQGGFKEVLEDIYDQNAESTSMAGSMPVHAWYQACNSLASEFPHQLGTITNRAMVERVFQYLNKGFDGILSKKEFVEGMYDLLNPETQRSEAKMLQKRLIVGIFHIPNGGIFERVKTVGIIGAGVAGLQTAARLIKAGLQVKIFDKSTDVGGVWLSNYADFGLQVPRELYEFPDFPYPSDMKADKFPSGPQVEEYIQRYAKHHDLYKVITFNAAVSNAGPTGVDKRGWTINYSVKDEARAEAFDFLVVATGMYGWPPHLPVARGYKEFKGEILHSCTFTDRTQAAGKKVVVVGGGKSAVDNAVAASKEGVSSTLLCRSWHWPVPRYLLNLIPFKFGTYSRFGHFMLEPHHDEKHIRKWFHGTCAPVKWLWWRVVETMFKCQFGLPKNMVPEENIELDLFTGGQILNYEFRDRLKEKKVNIMKASIDKFTPSGVILTDKTEIECDMVIYATGFVKSYKIFDPLIQEKLNVQRDGLYLYRNMIPPRLPDLAFIGCEVSTFNNVLTHGLQAVWLERLLTNKHSLPKTSAMEQSIEKEIAWKRSWMPPSSARASIWQLHMMKYHDKLCEDLKEKRMRKMPNCLSEILMPYSAADYRSIFK